MQFNSILLYTFPAIDISIIPLESFIRFEAFLGIGMMMFSCHVLESLSSSKLPLLFQELQNVKNCHSAVIASSERGDLLFFIDFIAVMSSSFVTFDILISGLVVLLEFLMYLLDH